MLATFFIAFMTFIFEMQNDFFVALLYSIAVAGIGAYIYLTVERYFENKLEKWTKEESNKNRKRAKIDAIIIFLSTVALFIILKRIDLIIIYPVFFILFIEVAYKNAGNRWND